VPAQRIDLKDFKRVVREVFPLGSTTREVLLAEPDYISPEALIHRSEIYVKLLEIEKSEEVPRSRSRRSAPARTGTAGGWRLMREGKPRNVD